MDSSGSKGPHGYGVDVGLSGMTDRWDSSTHTIDLRGVFSTNLSTSGSFDLRELGSTSLTKLLDALPVPALLIDLSYSVVFTNKSWDAISPNFKTVMGLPFSSLIPRARNAEKAQLLMDKVFRSRSSQVAEGILEVQKKKLWGRIHFRPVRTGADRFVLIVVEDLTAEKTRLLVDKRHREDLRKAHDLHTAQVRKLSDRLNNTNWKLSQEVVRNREAQDALRTAHRKFKIVADKASIGIVLASRDGSVYYVNAKFRELFGYDLENVPELASWFGDTPLPFEREDRNSEQRVKECTESGETDTKLLKVELACLNGGSLPVSATIDSLEDGNCVLTFEEVPKDPESG